MVTGKYSTNVESNSEIKQLKFNAVTNDSAAHPVPAGSLTHPGLRVSAAALKSKNEKKDSVRVTKFNAFQ